MAKTDNNLKVEEIQEVWKAIPQWEEVYEVSNRGRVRRIANKRGVAKGGILTPHTTPSGYLHVTLHWNGKVETRRIHQLVARAFLPSPKFGEQINHIDGNKKNNCPMNLEWCTAQENSLHAVKLGLKPTGELHYSNTNPEKLARGERNGMALLTDSQVLEVYQLTQEGMKSPEIMRLYPISKSLVSAIRNRKTRHHLFVKS